MPTTTRTSRRKKRTLQQGLDGTIARQIQVVRDRQTPHVSQQRLAELLGITQATVTRMESGERAFTVAEVFQIAAVLNVSPLYLLGGTFTLEKVPVTEKLKLEPEDMRQWLLGHKPLPGADESVFLDRNIPDVIARQRRESVQMVDWLNQTFPPGTVLTPPGGGPSIRIGGGSDNAS